jgi:hypothetical protein
MATRNIVDLVSTLLSLYRNGTKFEENHIEGITDTLHSDTTADKTVSSFRYNFVNQERDRTEYITERKSSWTSEWLSTVYLKNLGITPRLVGHELYGFELFSTEVSTAQRKS